MLFKELLRLLPSHKSTKKDILSFARAATRMAKSTTPTVSEVTEFAKTKALGSQDHAMLRRKPKNSRCLSSFPKDKHGDTFQGFMVDGHHSEDFVPQKIDDWQPRK